MIGIILTILVLIGVIVYVLGVQAEREELHRQNEALRKELDRVKPRPQVKAKPRMDFSEWLREKEEEDLIMMRRRTILTDENFDELQRQYEKEMAEDKPSYPEIDIPF